MQIYISAPRWFTVCVICISGAMVDCLPRLEKELRFKHVNKKSAEIVERIRVHFASQCACMRCFTQALPCCCRWSGEASRRDGFCRT